MIKRPKIPNTFSKSTKEQAETILVDLVRNEYQTAKNNQQVDNSIFSSIIEILENKRSEKDYEWLSNVALPEMASIILTSASNQANQLFQTRDFVEVRLSGINPQDERKCQAAKLTLNNTLNRKDLFHYHKYMRAVTINLLAGHVYLLCGWEQKTKSIVTGQQLLPQELDIDEYGNPISDLTTQKPAIRYTPQDITSDFILKDNFNYTVFDPRNVFTDSKYAYSAQEKDWITFRDEVCYWDLKQSEEEFNYFNLDLIKTMDEANATPSKTDTASESYDSIDQKPIPPLTPVKYFDRLRRYGRTWAIVDEYSLDGYPLKIRPGYDRFGERNKKAVLLDTITTIIANGTNFTLIGFQPNPFRDTKGNTYRPIVRAWCYIHPAKDTGLSDGMYLRELQIAANDAFNMGADRTKLATLPVFRVRRLSAENNSSLFIEPEHFIELENIDDLQELQIKDNIAGTIELTAMLANKMQQVSATYPTTMGDIPTKASTTATAIAGAESRSNLRANYKSLTIEYTLFQEFYWMILQMTAQFAKKETAVKLMGEEYIYDFDPEQDYTYNPVTSQIEQEYNKYRRVQNITQMLGLAVNIPNPNTPKLLNYLLGKAFELFGDQFPDYKKYLLDENYQPPQLASPASTPGQISNTASPGTIRTPTSNQTGNPQTAQEQYARLLSMV